MVLEVLPMPKEVGEMAPIYFKVCFPHWWPDTELVLMGQWAAVMISVVNSFYDANIRLTTQNRVFFYLVTHRKQ